MAAIVNSNLAGFTVKYNGVQFGGADSTYKSLPPFYSYRARFRYDSAGRAVIGQDCTLNVRCIFYASSLAEMTSTMANIREALSQPAKELRIEGLGSGLGLIVDPLGTYADIANGPKPQFIECNALGQLAWEVAWSVDFFISDCFGQATFGLAFLAFNFNTTWQNDFEGLCTRTITGHVIIPQVRQAASSKTVLHVAEESRGNIVVAVPPNFRRAANVWRESEDKSRLDFTIVDEHLQGDPLPAGITDGDGSFTFAAGDGKGGFANAVCSLSMSLTTAINQPRNLAGQIFLAAVISKQAQMHQALIAAGAPQAKALLVPIRLTITNGKFRSARRTEANVVWSMASPLSAMLSAAGIWQPMGSDYTTWKASVASLWGNRGFAGLQSSASEAVVIDLCDNQYTKTIGVVGSSPNNPVDASLDSLSCPDVPDDGGWMAWELDIRVLRHDQQTLHKRASQFLPQTGISGQDPGSGTSVTLGGPAYSQSDSDKHVVEYQGYPETYIGLKFKGLRFKHLPFMPELSKVAGLPAVMVDQDPGTPKWAFDSFGCPVYSLVGWRIYRVAGYVPSVGTMGSKVSAGSPNTPIEL